MMVLQAAVGRFVRDIREAAEKLLGQAAGRRMQDKAVAVPNP
jgi:hypothetical protein